jgi:hypothetical protein
VKCDHFSYSTVSRASRIGRLLPATNQAPVSIAAATTICGGGGITELSVMKVYAGMEAKFKYF